jgi:tetratricopeptide (TPR) repeat protein
MPLIKNSIFILLLAICHVATAQVGITEVSSTDEALAAQYFANGEFDKAAVLYEKLLDENPQSPYYYENLLTSFFKLKDFDKAEKMVKKQRKRFDDFGYKVDLGYVYDKKGETRKAENEYEDCLKGLKKGSYSQEFLDLTNAYTKRDLYPWAIKTIEKARKIFEDQNILALELGALYMKAGNKEKMVVEYLNYLSLYPEDMQTVQNSFLDRLTNDEDWKLLKKEILTRIQTSPDAYMYSEMLMWLLVQQKDFYGAFLQFRAIDKRQKEEGRRLIDLAQIAITNEAFDVAVDCYKYVIGLGNDKTFYFDARSGLLSVSYKKIVEYGDYDDAFLAETEKSYIDFIAEIGKNYISANPMRELAYLYNYYLDRPTDAITLLQEVITIPRTNKSFVAECKLELGDAYLVSGDIWEAQLLYGQVDKDFKDEPLGQEAKFRNARLSFYKGEFEWAQAQLDVLKSATSHLISNNAIELSMLIQDNHGFEDGDDSALMLYAEADLLLLRNAPDLAMQKLDSIKLKYPHHSLNDELLLSKARIYRKKKNYTKAAEFYTDVYTNYQYDILADNAIFELAEVYERKLNNPEKAKELYEKIILDYPGSLYNVEARKRFRRLRGDGIKDIPQEILDYRQ